MSGFNYLCDIHYCYYVYLGSIKSIVLILVFYYMNMPQYIHSKISKLWGCFQFEALQIEV